MDRGGSPPQPTEPWHRGAVRGANRTVGVTHSSVCGRTAPHGSLFEPWSTLIGVRVGFGAFASRFVVNAVVRGDRKGSIVIPLGRASAHHWE